MGKALSKINTVKHSPWITAVVGLHYLEEGLQYFCDDVVTELHAKIMERCPKKCDECDECNLETLQPNHICEGKMCPLGYQNCNCRKTNVKLLPCPNRICGFIYDEIINLYGSTSPTPNWENTDINQWCTNPWAVATCFIPITSYLDRKCVAEFDCAELLLLIMENKAFLEHLDCKIDGKDAFSQAFQIRNELFHSSSLDLKKEEAHRYIDVMIKVLQDQRELFIRHESMKAVNKLVELKEEVIRSALDVERINNIIETGQLSLIQYLTNKLILFGLETFEECYGILHPGRRHFTQLQKLDEEEAKGKLERRLTHIYLFPLIETERQRIHVPRLKQTWKLDTSVAEQEDKRKLVGDFFTKIYPVLSEVLAIVQDKGQGAAKYIDDPVQALRICVVQVEILDMKIKKLKQKQNKDKYQEDDKKGDSRWKDFIFCWDEGLAKKNLADGICPKESELNEICRHLGRKCEIVKEIITLICKCIMKNNSKIESCSPFYRPDNGDNCLRVVFVVETKESEVNIPEYTIVQRNRELDTENSYVIEQEVRNDKLPSTKLDTAFGTTLKEELDKLWKSHSNLTTITMSCYKLSKYGDVDGHDLKETDCIVFCVDGKGLIPFDEEPFPKKVGDFDTDVRECHLYLHNSLAGWPTNCHENLLQGCDIGFPKEHTTSQGTIGCFLSNRNDQYVYAMTCAHVALNYDQLMETRRNGGTRAENHPTLKCLGLWFFGGCEHRCFQPASSNTRAGILQQSVFKESEGVDVSVIKVDRRRSPQSCNFPTDPCELVKEMERNRIINNQNNTFLGSDFVNWVVGRQTSAALWRGRIVNRQDAEKLGKELIKYFSGERIAAA